MATLDDKGTWQLVPLPFDKSVVGCCWVFTVKYNPDGSVERYKARFVAKCYTQTYGVDYGEAFCPIAKIASVWILISLDDNLGWPLFKIV